jgi:hypothetical protein
MAAASTVVVPGELTSNDGCVPVIAGSSPLRSIEPEEGGLKSVKPGTGLPSESLTVTAKAVMDTPSGTVRVRSR